VTAEPGGLAARLELVARPDDIVMAFGEANEPELAAALDAAGARGCLTIAFASLGAAYELAPPSEDPVVRQELVETLYHVLWELVHVFFEHRGLLAGRTDRRSLDVGASSFLYPFLGEQEDDLEGVLQDVAASVVMKAEEASSLRAQYDRSFTLVTPGIRLAGAERNDQARTVTPEVAIGAGADYLVIGRPITQAADPPATLRAINVSLANVGAPVA